MSGGSWTPASVLRRRGQLGGDRCLAPAAPVFIRSDARGGPSTQQCLAGCPCAGDIPPVEEMPPPRREQGDRQPVAVEHAVAGQRGELRTRRQYSHQIERIGGGE